MKLTLKALRVNANMTQEDVSKAVNISVKTLNKWEQPNGLQTMRLDKLKELLDLYGASFDDVADFYCDEV